MRPVTAAAAGAATAGGLVLFTLFGGLFGPAALLTVPATAFLLLLGPVALGCSGLDAWHFPRNGLSRRLHVAATLCLAALGILLLVVAQQMVAAWRLGILVSALGLLALAERAQHAALSARAAFHLGAAAGLFCVLALGGLAGAALGVAGLLGLQTLRQPFATRLALALACVPALLTLDVLVEGTWLRRGIEAVLFLGIVAVAWTQRARIATVAASA